MCSMVAAVTKQTIVDRLKLRQNMTTRLLADYMSLA